MWSYVYYIHHIDKKNKSDFTGIESYVSDQLKRGQLKWVPSRTSWSIEQEGLKQEDALSDELRGHHDKLKSGIDDVLSVVVAVR